MIGFPRRSYYGKSHARPVRVNQDDVKRKTVVTPKKQINSFEAEYQKFIAELKAKKAAEEAKKEETPVVEEPKSEVIPETVTTVEKDAPILNEEKVVEPTIEGLD